MKTILLLAFCSVLFSCSYTDQDRTAIKSPSSYFPEDKAKVLVVGTFHFDYPGLDAHVTSEEDKVDVLMEPKKSEVTELVSYIMRFSPNKIAIEAMLEWNAGNKLKKYLEGEYRDKRDERYQIAMRIAAETGIDTLYSIDAESMVPDLEQLDSAYVEKLFADFDFNSEDPYEQYLKEWLTEDDKLVTKTNLLEYFKYMNSRESHLYGYGAYLVGDFKLDSMRGADILAIWWYNRNLRIFRKLQAITEGSDDRILVVVGNGHAAVLRQLLECSPEYEFVEYDSL